MCCAEIWQKQQVLQFTFKCDEPALIECVKRITA
jgi:hypothetical protein